MRLPVPGIVCVGDKLWHGHDAFDNARVIGKGFEGGILGVEVLDDLDAGAFRDAVGRETRKDDGDDAGGHSDESAGWVWAESADVLVCGEHGAAEVCCEFIPPGFFVDFADFGVAAKSYVCDDDIEFAELLLCGLEQIGYVRWFGGVAGESVDLDGWIGGLELRGDWLKALRVATADGDASGAGFGPRECHGAT